MSSSQAVLGQSTHIYLFGDQISNLDSRLRNLLSLDSDPILKAFFEGAYRVLRAEVGKLSQQYRQQFPRFSSIQDLLALHRQCQLHPSFNQPLNCTFQLGAFIRYDLCCRRMESFGL